MDCVRLPQARDLYGQNTLVYSEVDIRGWILEVADSDDFGGGEDGFWFLLRGWWLEGGFIIGFENSGGFLSFVKLAEGRLGAVRQAYIVVG